MLRASLAALAAAAASAATPCALSNVFGDHMVLQRDQPSTVFGFAPPGTAVTTTFAGNKYTAPTGADGVWRQQLLAQPATAAPAQISFSCSTGEAFGLNDVLFGDVVLCGGQVSETEERLRVARNIGCGGRGRGRRRGRGRGRGRRRGRGHRRGRGRRRGFAVAAAAKVRKPRVASRASRGGLISTSRPKLPQSNMQFTLPQIGEQDGYDAAGEIAAAANYPSIRAVTVGQTTTSYSPLQQLAVAPIAPWGSVTNANVIAQGNWSATSATCWFYARNLADNLKIPIGMVSSNWGGTIIQSWSSNATLASCGITEGGAADAALPAGAENRAADFVSPGFEERVGAGPDPNTGFGVLYNAMIAPFALGPMTISSMIWFQGESNNGQDALYECVQPAMIQQWRTDFKAANAFFGFVEMEPWVGGPAPDFRLAQLAALSLPNVGYGQASDCGDPTGPFGSIHPRNKKLIGARLAAAALSLQYKVPGLNWKSPSAKSCAASAGAVATVAFTDVPTTLVAAADHCKTELGVPAAQCAGFVVTGSDGKTYNATAAVGADGRSVVITASGAPAGTAAAATSFGYAQWPINTIMTAEGLPLQPWPSTPCA